MSKRERGYRIRVLDRVSAVVVEVHSENDGHSFLRHGAEATVKVMSPSEAAKAYGFDTVQKALEAALRHIKLQRRKED